MALMRIELHLCFSQPLLLPEIVFDRDYVSQLKENE